MLECCELHGALSIRRRASAQAECRMPHPWPSPRGPRAVSKDELPHAALSVQPTRPPKAAGRLSSVHTPGLTQSLIWPPALASQCAQPPIRCRRLPKDRHQACLLMPLPARALGAYIDQATCLRQMSGFVLPLSPPIACRCQQTAEPVSRSGRGGDRAGNATSRNEKYRGR